MNAQEAERLSIERKPLFESEMKEEYRIEEEEKFNRICGAIEDAANRGDQEINWHQGIFVENKLGYLTQELKDKLMALDYYVNSEYNGSYTDYNTISWGDKKKEYEANPQQTYPIKKPKKKWWQIF